MLFYLFVYNKAECLPENHIFVHGRLLSFDDISASLVYEDEEYVCYDLSQYIYSDYNAYFKKIAENSNRIPPAYKELETLRAEVKEQLGGLLTRHEND